MLAVVDVVASQTIISTRTKICAVFEARHIPSYHVQRYASM